MENHGRRPEVVAARAAGYGTSVRHSATLQADLLYLARTLGPDRRGPVLRLAIPQADLRQVEARYEWLPAADLRGVRAARARGTVAIGRLAHPIREVTDAALAVAQRDLAREAPERGPAEISRALLGAHPHEELAPRFGRAGRTGTGSSADAVFETLPDGVVVIDSHYRVIDANRAFRL